jgi:hypothetical protein
LFVRDEVLFDHQQVIVALERKIPLVITEIVGITSARLVLARKIMEVDTAVNQQPLMDPAFSGRVEPVQNVPVLSDGVVDPANQAGNFPIDKVEIGGTAIV